ncbi:hypothetical protein B0H12DRAFT_1244122 [Mycena haematopus]|nr:hypothetical protein B0H12DRAFT_1244122 [Mycena haematopus]
MNLQAQKKKKTRSLLPRIEPVSAAPETPRVRPRSRPTATVHTDPQPWSPDAEAAWQVTTAELSAAEPKILGADTAETDAEREQARERQQTWDRLMVQVLDLMPEPRRRQWLAEQRVEEEWRSRSAPKARDLDAFSDWLGSGSREYVD